MNNKTRHIDLGNGHWLGEHPSPNDQHWYLIYDGHPLRDMNRYENNFINQAWAAGVVSMCAHPSKPAGKDDWQKAVDDQLVSTGSTTEAWATPKQALDALIAWHVAVALDPVVNGGFVMVRAEPITGDAYANGLWSRRNFEAYLADQFGKPSPMDDVTWEKTTNSSYTYCRPEPLFPKDLFKVAKDLSKPTMDFYCGPERRR